MSDLGVFYLPAAALALGAALIFYGVFRAARDAIAKKAVWRDDRGGATTWDGGSTSSSGSWSGDGDRQPASGDRADGGGSDSGSSDGGGSDGGGGGGGGGGGD